MATMTIKYNPRSVVAMSMLNAMRASNAFEMIELPKKPKGSFYESLEDVKAGRVYQAADEYDLIHKILG
ncbi:MAG: hypothetical protein KBS42_01385 [Bacteroidales bacterium]|nr:hypothetical protein [Candidatus Colicola coprequi]